MGKPHHVPEPVSNFSCSCGGWFLNSSDSSDSSPPQKCALVGRNSPAGAIYQPLKEKWVGPHTTGVASIIKNNKYEQGPGNIGTLVHCWWECKVIQLLWKTLWWFLKNLKIERSKIQSSNSVLGYVFR